MPSGPALVLRQSRKAEVSSEEEKGALYEAVGESVKEIGVRSLLALRAANCGERCEPLLMRLKCKPSSVATWRGSARDS